MDCHHAANAIRLDGGRNRPQIFNIKKNKAIGFRVSKSMALFYFTLPVVFL